MTAVADLSDIAPVTIEELSVPMHYLIQTGRGLAMLRGLSEADLREVETMIWSHEGIAAQRRMAVAVRFRSFIAAFAARRLQQLLLERGFPLIAPAIAAAASLRLNQKWGFNPQRFLAALQASVAEAEVAVRPTRIVSELQPEQLAA